MPDSVRELVLAEMQRVFADTVAGDTGGGTVWKTVLDTDIAGFKTKGQNVMGIIEGNETYIDVVSPDKRDRSLEVDLQTRVYVPKNTAIRAGANSVLADLEEIIEVNRLWGGLAYATTMLANSILREDQGDRVVEISMFINVRYRTKRTDPRART